MSKTPLTLINMSDVESVPVKWLWKPYIPLGKITIIQGDPGEGKKALAVTSFKVGESWYWKLSG